MSKAGEYLARAKQIEAQAKKERCPKARDWQLLLARAYRKLAEAESEMAKLRLLAAA